MSKSSPGPGQASSSKLPRPSSTPVPLDRKPFFQAPFNLADFKSPLVSLSSDPLQPSLASLALFPSAKGPPSDAEILAQQRCESTLQLLGRWEKIAEKYKGIGLEDDDEILLSSMRVVKNRGTLEASSKRWFGESICVSSGEESDGEDKEAEEVGEDNKYGTSPSVDQALDDTDFDPLDSWGPQSLDIQISRAIPDALKPVVIFSLPKPAKLPAWTEETNSDLREFLRAEEARRAACGEKGMEEEGSGVEDAEDWVGDRQWSAKEKGKGRAFDLPSPVKEEFIPVHLRGTRHLPSPIPSTPSSSARKSLWSSPSSSTTSPYLEHRIRELGLNPGKFRATNDGKRHIIDLSLRDSPSEQTSLGDADRNHSDFEGSDPEEEDPLALSGAAVPSYLPFSPSDWVDRPSRRSELPWQPGFNVKLESEHKLKWGLTEERPATDSDRTALQDSEFKKRRGRPKGSKNKVKVEPGLSESIAHPQVEASPDIIKYGPRGPRKNALPVLAVEQDVFSPVVIKRKVGRPRKNGLPTMPSAELMNPRSVALAPPNGTLPDLNLDHTAALKPRKSVKLKSGATVEWVIVPAVEQAVALVDEEEGELKGKWSMRKRRAGIRYQEVLCLDQNEDDPNQEDPPVDLVVSPLGSAKRGRGRPRKVKPEVEVENEESWVDMSRDSDMGIVEEKLSPKVKQHDSWAYWTKQPSIQKPQQDIYRDVFNTPALTSSKPLTLSGSRRKEHRSFFIDTSPKSPSSSGKKRGRKRNSCASCLEHGRITEATICAGRMKGRRCWYEKRAVKDESVLPEALGSAERRKRRPITLSPDTEDEGPATSSQVGTSNIADTAAIYTEAVAQDNSTSDIDRSHTRPLDSPRTQNTLSAIAEPSTPFQPIVRYASPTSWSKRKSSALEGSPSSALKRLRFEESTSQSPTTGSGKGRRFGSVSGVSPLRTDKTDEVAYGPDDFDDLMM